MKLLVEIEMPKQANEALVISYVEDALATHRGSLRYPGGYDDNDPGDPMWHLNTKKIKVTKAS